MVDLDKIIFDILDMSLLDNPDLPCLSQYDETVIDVGDELDDATDEDVDGKDTVLPEREAEMSIEESNFHALDANKIDQEMIRQVLHKPTSNLNKECTGLSD